MGFDGVFVLVTSIPTSTPTLEFWECPFSGIAGKTQIRESFREFCPQVRMILEIAQRKQLL